MNGKPRQVVLITGASAGIGRAAARAFADQGADVALVARGPEGLEAAAREAESKRRRALVISADVANPDEVEAAAERTERELGPIDVWVNDAMVSVFSPFVEMTPDDFRRVTEVSYLGYVYGTLAALKRMRPRNRGVVVQVGSALAYRGIPLQSAYCGAKHAIQGFTESVRCELLHEGSGVHITMVQMPAVNTPQFDWSKTRLPRQPQPVPPIYQPEVAAKAIVFAARNRRREVFVGGSTAVVIEGNKAAPGLGDHYLGWTGYESQMTEEPIDRDRPNNLWAPLPGDRGAHGRFDDRATRLSWQLEATMHRGWLALAALAGAGLAVWWKSKATAREDKMDVRHGKHT